LDFADGDGRRWRLPGLADKRQTAALAANVKRLLSVRFSGDALPPDLLRWLENVPADFRQRLADAGLIDRDRAGGLRPLLELDGTGKIIGVSEILVGKGANVRYGLVQRWEPGVVGHLTARARVFAGAHFQMSLASFGGTAFKADVGAFLAGEAAEVETYGVAMGGDSQHFDHHTEHIHETGRTHSNLDFKVVLTGSARSAYTGMIRIAPGAAGSEAYQENRNLLLSEGARAESIPELEILTDDVRCSHGATVSPLDPEQLFYLESRGIPRLQAMRVIVYGFLDQTLARLPQTTRERIAALVAARLHTD